MRHKKAAVCCLLAMMAAALFADDWVLAAEAFSGDEAVGTLMPSLILDAIPTNLTRTVSPQEQIFRKLLVLEKDCESATSELDKLIRERDTVIFTTSDELTRRDKITDYERKIADARQMIQADREEMDKLNTSVFSDDDAAEDFTRLEEKVVLWNKSTSSLYNRSGKDEPSDIRALITGSVQVRNGFVYVRAGLLVYPGAIACNEIVVAGELADTALLAEEIASGLVDTIVNAQPVSLSFTIEPAAVRKNAEVTIDGMNVQNPESPHAFQSGIHTISVEAPGYEKLMFTRDFSDAARYQIAVQLPQLNPVNLELAARTSDGLAADGAQMWVAGKSVGMSPATISVNGRQVLGLIQNEEGIPTYFALDTVGRNTSASVTLRQESSQSRIEKARKSLYTSYGLLLISLPFTFYFYGRMNDAYIAYTGGLQTSGTAAEFYKWQRLERISLCVSIGLGGNMIYRLVKYMLAADSVLPEKAETEKEEK